MVRRCGRISILRHIVQGAALVLTASAFLSKAESGGYLQFATLLYNFPIIRIVNEPGTGVPWAPRPPPGGGGDAGPRSWLIVKMWFVLVSNVIVRAPFIVSRFCSTSKLVGLFSLTMVNVPLPCVLKASMVDGLNAAPSEPPASGSRSRIFPSFALRMTNVCGGFALGSGGGAAGTGWPGVPRAA